MGLARDYLQEHYRRYQNPVVLSRLKSQSSLEKETKALAFLVRSGWKHALLKDLLHWLVRDPFWSGHVSSLKYLKKMKKKQTLSGRD
jgi:hypothetical protein